jgi:secreted trypsin-like serine protease
MALFAQQPGSQEGALCTASLISPTVLLTAAHCVSAEEVGDGAVFGVYTGSDLNNADNSLWVDVDSVDHDQAFDSSDLEGGHDVGIVVLKQPITDVQPVAFATRSLSSSIVGKSIRLVGYGLSNAANQTGAGTKRQTTASVDNMNSLLVEVGSTAHGTCNGDSGGPAFATIGGVETIIGVTSFGSTDCTGGGFDTRIDKYVSFINSHLQ